jgi:hypothetical protein
MLKGSFTTERPENVIRLKISLSRPRGTEFQGGFRLGSAADVSPTKCLLVAVSFTWGRNTFPVREHDMPYRESTAHRCLELATSQRYGTDELVTAAANASGLNGSLTSDPKA